MSEGELDELMGEVGGPCNVMGMVNMFQEKLAGGDGNDPDELILQAFMAYDQAGKIDVKMSVLPAWSTCSRRSWLEETATTPMSLSSRLSWPTIRPARLTSRCSSTLSPPGETRLTSRCSSTLSPPG